MKRQVFSIDIKAPRAKVWRVLWDDESFRDWANLIDEGMTLVGELKEGNTVEFVSAVGGYGVRSQVVRLVPGELVSLKHLTDTEDLGAAERADEWTGGTEDYTLVEQAGVTTLKLATDVPPTQEATMSVRLPLALDRVRALAEGAASRRSRG
jgi:uncharacterized protein YndB with AHSA1/START domain